LRAQHQVLHERLEQALEGETLLTRSELGAGEVVVAIRTSYVQDVVKEMARRYLDHVSLELSDIHVHENGDLKKGTFLGQMTLGTWDVQIDVSRLSGVLGGHTPQLQIGGDNDVQLVMPVSVREGHGEGDLRFTWDARSMVDVVCHDFEVRERLQATVVP